MGAASREFLDVRMSQEVYEQIPNELYPFIEVKLVRVVGEDYENDELWHELKKKSDKAYKELKDREFDLRHNIKKR
jgi:hypothetical protein